MNNVFSDGDIREMNGIEIIRLPHPLFDARSLDGFIRHQVVTECWRKADGEWRLLPAAFTEEWSPEKCREEASDILDRADNDLIAYAAVRNGETVGYITLAVRPAGTDGQYLQVEGFQVSEPYRGRGIGRKLFSEACNAARAAGAEKLYISSHPSKESQAAYKALGCVHAKEIIPRIADAEPFDVQLEYVL